MTQQNRALPAVLNLTSRKHREQFDADRELVQSELARLIVKDVPLLPDHSPDVCIAPRIGGEAPSLSSDEVERLLGGLKQHTFDRLSELKLVLLLDRWPSAVVEGVISEPLGVYIDDLEGKVLKNLKPHLAEKGLYEEIEAACQRVSSQVRSKVPTVILLMEAIAEDSSAQKWSGFTELAGGHSWLTTKVLHHELGHHVFPIADPKDYKPNDSSPAAEAAVTLAEGGANWFAWMIGTSAQRYVLGKFSEEQDDPYKAYKALVEWAEMKPIAPGVVWSTDALMNRCEKTNAFTSAVKDARSARWPFDHFKIVVDSCPKWLPSHSQLEGLLRGLIAKNLIQQIASRKGESPAPASEEPH